MTTFTYEPHLHTSEASACAVTSGVEYITAYYNAGYNGIIVTDHFFNGNSAIDSSLPWQGKVEQFCRGYENAFYAAMEFNGIHQNELPFRVFFGFEYNFDCDEYLIYGLDKEWLLKHPEIMHLSHAQLFKTVDNYGGLMVQAHPFRKRSYIRDIHLHPECVHAVEAYNSANSRDENFQACCYAASHNLPVTSGSDMHNSAALTKISDLDANNSKRHDNISGGMVFSKPLQDINDYITAVKDKTGYTALGINT